MDIKKIRIALWIILAFILVVLWTKWQQAHQPPIIHASHQAVAQAADNGDQDQIPQLTATSAAHTTTQLPKMLHHGAAERRISVTTNTLHLMINLQGGNLVTAYLREYPKTLHSKQPVALLATNSNKTYVAQSGIISNLLPSRAISFHAEKRQYSFKPGMKQLTVNLSAAVNGVKLIKQYIFMPNSYAIKVRYRIDNQSGQSFKGRFYGQLLRTEPKKSGNFLMSYANYTGAAISYPGNHFDKVSFKDMREQDLQQNALGGWVAMLQHYFISAWAPDQQQKSEFYSRIYHNDLYTIGFAGPVVNVPPGQSKALGATLYVGPAIAKNLEQVAPYLDKTINYGWLWFISILIFKVMSWIHHYIGNWGWSIVLITLLIKLIF